MLAVSIKNLQHRVGRLALSIDELNIRKGVVTGIYAPKRGGKSTLMQLIAGLSRPNKGRIEVFGRLLSEDDHTRGSVAYVSSEFGFVNTSKISSVIKSYKRFYPDFDEQLLDKLLTSFSISKTDRLHALSVAQSLKLSYSFAIARHPRLLLIDDLSGEVDPIVANGIMYTIQPFLDEESTFIFTTSRIGDLERHAKDVIILENGKVKKQVELDSYCQNCYAFSGKCDSFDENVNGLRYNSDTIHFMVDSAEQMQEIKTKYPSLNAEKMSQNEILAYLTRGENTDE